MRLYFARLLVVLGFFGLCWLGGQETLSQEVPQVVQVPLPGQAPLPTQAGPEGQVPRGVEVQARGPVHEAFATPTGEPKPTGAVNKKPPAPIEEMAPEEKPEGDMTWIAGYWAWDDDRSDYLWVSGCWRAKPQGKDWVPGYWREQGELWQWVPGFWANAATKEAPAQEVTYYPEPPAPPQLAPAGDPPSSDMIYVPGNWYWYGNHYTWRAGYWTRGRPGYVYVPSHYRWTPYGYVFVPGYWDLAVARRGVLYAPVVIDATVVVGGRFVYTPYYAVPDTFMLDALFVRPATCHYYFGDYYGPRYRTLGFESSVIYSRGHYDAIVVYQRWEYRDNPRWLDLRVNLVVARDSGRAPLPPRTLVQQTTVINNVTNVTNVSNINVSKTTVLAPAKTVMAAQGIKTVAVDPAARAQIKASSQAAQQAALAQRQKTEVAVPGAQNQGKPRVASYHVPATAFQGATGSGHAGSAQTGAPGNSVHATSPGTTSLGNTVKPPGTTTPPGLGTTTKHPDMTKNSSVTPPGTRPMSPELNPRKTGPLPARPTDAKKDDNKKKGPNN